MKRLKRIHPVKEFIPGAKVKCVDNKTIPGNMRCDLELDKIYTVRVHPFTGSDGIEYVYTHTTWYSAMVTMRYMPKKRSKYYGKENHQDKGYKTKRA
jgi:hypothetical protein